MMKLPVKSNGHVIRGHSEAVVEHANAALADIIVVQHGILHVRVRTFDVTVHLKLRHDRTFRGYAGGAVAAVGVC